MNNKKCIFNLNGILVFCIKIKHIYNKYKSKKKLI